MERGISKIGFISTRIAGTDGVSLEIEKWATVLERNGFECFYFAGELDREKEKSYIAPQAHFDHPEQKEIHQQLFGRNTRNAELTSKIEKLKNLLKAQIYKFYRRYELELIIPENSLTIPMNIPLGLAITEFIAETGLPAIAHHHDFYWERDRFLINACQDYLNKSFPPDLPSLQHVVINSLASQQLSHRLGISNTIIPNVYDFANESGECDTDSSSLKEDIGLNKDEIFILQPTRIVPRKWIERSIEIVNRLFPEQGSLVISHASGDEGDDYFNRISEYAKNMNVKLYFAEHLINNGRSGNSEYYTIADFYQCADIITYPSGYEGFGNAFLETIYYKKPIIVNRYSIYIADIEPKNFEVIPLNGFVTAEAVSRIRRVLNDAAYRERIVEKNYRLAAKFFSFEVLERKLIHLIGNLTF